MNLHGKTNEELCAMQQAIQTDPTNRAPGGLYIYTKGARAKLDAIARQITANLAAKRAAAGNLVPCDGYSGRQSNRR